MVAKGDIPIIRAADDADYLSVSGTDGNILTEDSTALDGAKWAPPAPVTLGYAEVVAQQGSIVTETDLTSLTVTVTVAASRRLRISGYCAFFSTVAADSGRLSIKEGATLLQLGQDSVPGATQAITLNPTRIIIPSAGSHTYKLTMQRTSGSGTLTMDAGATYPAFILVEDIT